MVRHFEILNKGLTANQVRVGFPPYTLRTWANHQMIYQDCSRYIFYLTLVRVFDVQFIGFFFEREIFTVSKLYK